MALNSICQFFNGQLPRLWLPEKYAPVVSQWRFRERLCVHCIILSTLLGNSHLGFGQEVTSLLLPNSFSSSWIQTCVGRRPPLIISHYFPFQVSMFWPCGTLPVWQKPNGSHEEGTLMGNRLQQPSSTPQSSPGVHLCLKLSRCCKVRHRKPAAAAFALLTVEAAMHLKRRKTRQRCLFI